MQSNPLSANNRVFTLSAQGSDSPQLRAGETVKAEVIGTGADNSVRIRVRDTVLDVRTDVPLHKGEVLTLRVERQESMVYLRLPSGAAERPGEALNAIQAALDGLGEKVPGAAGMVQLLDLLSSLPAQVRQRLPEADIIARFLIQIDHLNGRSLRTLVEDGGIFFENKLRVLALGMETDGVSAEIEAGRIIAGDLKASLLRLKDTFLNAPGVLADARTVVRPDELLDALNAVLRNIEFYQLQSKMTDTLQFFLPLVWPSLRDGEVIIRESDRGAPGERSYSCTINLDLLGPGKVRVNLLLQAGYVHVSCSAESERFSRLFEQGGRALEEKFSGSGLRLGHLTVLHQPGLSFEGSHAAGLSIRA